MNEIFVRRKLEEFLAEDIGPVAVESNDSLRFVSARIIAEEPGVMCGGKLIVPAFSLITPDGVQKPRAIFLLEEGRAFSSGNIVARIDIEVETLRHGIRTVLNLLQHLSGIAAHTRKAVDEIKGLPAKLLDTRKTTPGLRVFEKYAVRVGGGTNHRFGRYDGILIKKEDIQIDGWIKKAIDRAFLAKSHLVSVEIEVETFEELEVVVADGRVSHVLLDNMSLKMMAEAVQKYGDKIIFEASGIGDKDLRLIAETGVHYISTSSLVRGAHPVKMKMRVGEN
ncbi:MAG: carboxylating nicotinate-nucleotide diphosphorylase [Candidatus Sungbacteria bacterium]|nr:carboxylating nicotinate-nucleotide diphosphorylase [Candidatus Sungbacteria bacterium]